MGLLVETLAIRSSHLSVCEVCILSPQCSVIPVLQCSLRVSGRRKDSFHSDLRDFILRFAYNNVENLLELTY